MKFKAKMDIDFNQNDLFEEKVQKATMAYAKNVSRKAMEEEINEEIARIAKNHMKKLHHCDGAFFNPISFKLSDKIVRKTLLTV